MYSTSRYLPMRWVEYRHEKVPISISIPFMVSMQHMLKVSFALLRLSTYNSGKYNTRILDYAYLPAYSSKVLMTERLGQSRRSQLDRIKAEIALCKPHDVTHHYLLLDRPLLPPESLSYDSLGSDDHCLLAYGAF